MNKQHRKPRHSLIPYATIQAASQGDAVAINTVLRHYEGYKRNLNRRGGPRHRGRMGQSPEKAKMPEQHKAVRALGVAIWVDKKRLFSQTWVEFAVAGVRLFLTVVYTIKRTRQYLLTVAVSFQSKRADNRILHLRVIGSASVRLAL